MIEKFVKGQFTEDDLEQTIIHYFTQEGYGHVNAQEEFSDDSEGVLREGELAEFLKERYKDDGITDNEVARAIAHLKNIHAKPLYQGVRETYRDVTSGWDMPRDDKSAVALHVSYINFDKPKKNVFVAVNQKSVSVSSEGDAKKRRPDLLLYVNGIPVCICEFKTAIKEDVTIHDAWVQITERYSRDIPALLKYCFLAVISDGVNTRMGSVFSPYKHFYMWSKIDEKDKVATGVSSLKTLIVGALSKTRICAILHDFIYFPDDSKKNEMIVCRYPQFFGTQKLLASIKANMRPKGNGKGGTYFGATGCGKTYTMLFLSRMLVKRDPEAFSNPTVLVIVDREDLETQTGEVFERATDYLGTTDVRVFESREELKKTLDRKPSGGVYLTTVQKFDKTVGLLSERANIICLSDEAHRTQTSLEGKLKMTDKGEIEVTHPFAQCLRTAFPRATYCGFTGTPVDETLNVFGKVVDKYTMKEASDDGITVRIVREPRLAKGFVNEEQAKKIQKYYDKCAEEGASKEQIAESQKAMSEIVQILKHPDLIHKLAVDIVEHYEKLCAAKPKVVQKAMVVCMTRPIAYRLLQEIEGLRPDWKVPRKAENESTLSAEELQELKALPKINLVATQGDNDEPDLYKACGTKPYRKMLDQQFKIDKSNFKIAIVVDMWITGFDVPSLAVMYIAKPIQRHTLIQTISRVNRVFEGKERGRVVDYIGFEKQMMAALKKYDGGKDDDPTEHVQSALKIFRDFLGQIDKLFAEYDFGGFASSSPAAKWELLAGAVEFVQEKRARQDQFMRLAQAMKLAYDICFTTGELTETEVVRAQFYQMVRAMVWKIVKGPVPDADTMNEDVEKMLKQTFAFCDVAGVFDEGENIEIYGEDFFERLKGVKMPATRFNAMVRTLKQLLSSYAKKNAVRALEFEERLKKVMDEYNRRDKVVFTNKVVEDLCQKIITISEDLKKVEGEFEKLGISVEEKAYYDILLKVRDDHKFAFAEEKCIALAKGIGVLVARMSQYPGWPERVDLRSEFKMELIRLMHAHGYPPGFNDEIYEKVLGQSSNFRHGRVLPVSFADAPEESPYESRMAAFEDPDA